jgi:hypothetical protein
MQLENGNADVKQLENGKGLYDTFSPPCVQRGYLLPLELIDYVQPLYTGRKGSMHLNIWALMISLALEGGVYSTERFM